MKTFAQKEIDAIRTLAGTTIPGVLNGADVTEEKYNASRMELNLHIIQALTGAEVVEPKKEGKQCKMKFNHSLPTKRDIADICQILEDFIRDVENPYLQSLAQSMATQQGNPDDMNIPAQNSQIIAGGIPAIDKVNNKILNNYVFGYDGKPAISGIALTAMDCITIAALGEEARKNANMKKAIIIGGIAVVLTGAAVAGGIMYNSKKKASANDDGCQDDDADMDDGVLDLDDAPTVDLDDADTVDLDNVVAADIG